VEKISVLAGNPRISFEDGKLLLDPQMHAFSMALEYAASVHASLTIIALAFDHLGLFRKQEAFYDPGLNISKTKRDHHVRLSFLHPEIKKHYQKIADFFGFPLIDIRVITEDTIRSKVFDQVEESNTQFFRPIDDMDMCMISQGSGSSSSSEPGRRQYKATCKGITASIISKLARHGENQINTYWQFDPFRCDPFSILTPGTQMAIDHLNVFANINQHIVFADDSGITKVETTQFRPKCLVTV
jgi:hypothetical protein